MISIHWILPLALLSSSTAKPGEIPWRTDLQTTLEEAANGNKVVFVAVNMDGERANDRLARETYGDDMILELASHTLNLVASNSDHRSGSKPCPRFGTVTCEDHRRVDRDVRDKVLAPDERGFVVAPQHVFLNPKGEVILSVPYDLKTPELEWCFVHALKTVNPDAKVAASAEARPPKRLMMGEVFSLGSEQAAQEQAPLSREAALELIKDLKKGTLQGQELIESVRKLFMADEPEALEYCRQLLRKAPGRSGKIGKAGGGLNRNDRRPALMHWIGANSPSSYWEVIIEFIGDSDPILRSEAIVAIEQLGDQGAVKGLVARLRKEKDEGSKKDLLRAIGTCGADDRSARSTLLKQAKSKRAPALQVNAILAMGWLSRHKDVDAVLKSTLEKGSEEARRAAVLAMGITRDPSWTEILQGELANAESEAYRNSIERSLAVLGGKGLAEMRSEVEELTGAEIERERIFGRSTKSRRERGGRKEGASDGSSRGAAIESAGPGSTPAGSRTSG